ncbi:protease SohB [Haliea sp. AH-315-K21]|uniref:Protease SohB n=1 Tax=SAR86 cluster bacterium TaxID=2030880 RepID=A0A2A5C750_9GAMM|nr:protease SohB [Haliea sp. AH-315-K21]PCJ39642.1 MAG: protease SohB [SAR86 cluster bacterium]
MEFIAEYGMFLAKVLTFTVAVVVVIVAAVGSAGKSKKEQKGSISITHLNKELDEIADEIKGVVEDEERLKREKKANKKAKKQERKEKKKDKTESDKKRCYVFDFNGDARASQVENMRKEITAVLSIIRPEQDEVILRLESPGGMVHAYGLAASQLARIRSLNIPLTICVDKVAASGGYMMACLGSKIIAAPFAYIGSIGVLMQLPNFNRLLKEKNVDFEMITAGEYKRTLTMFGENTDKGREKVAEEIQGTHDLFKGFVKENRPILEIDEVATGEVWLGTEALEKKLIDEIKTSDECIVDACKEADVYLIAYEKKSNIADRISKAMESAVDNSLLKWLHKSPRDHIS